MKRGNIFEDMPEKLTQEEIRTVASAPETRIERIVSTGQASPPDFWYDQDLDEWVVVLRGKAGLQFENADELVEMRAGDWIAIPAHERHRVAWTSPDGPTVWLAVHFPG